jgi:pyrimidine operon attenuation protein/uracil phosphoribosyltransferase
LANDAPPSSASERALTRNSAASQADSESLSPSASPQPERVVLDDTGIRRALMRIAHEIIEANGDISTLYLVAIPNGGVPLARILVENVAQLTDQTVPLGILDTTLYRDDLATSGTRPRLRRTEMPSSVDDRVVVLVEDVVNTGRTIRAAMDALMDFGRPSCVRVISLLDRGHRELPIKIDHVGKNIPTEAGEKVIFRGRKPDFQGGLEVVVQGGPNGATKSRDETGRVGGST